MFKKAKPLKDPSDVAHAYNYAIFLLGLRARTEGEIKKKMNERGYTTHTIGQVLEKLHAIGYLDDDTLTYNLIDSYKRHKFYGYYKIKLKLMEKRLSPHQIEVVLEDHYPIADELKVAQAFVKKQQSIYGKAGAKLSVEQKQRLVRQLKTRGFRSAVVAKILASF